MTTSNTTHYGLGKPETGDVNWGPVLNNNATIIDGAIATLDGRVDALEGAPGGSTPIKVDQELVTFDQAGAYVLANAANGIVAGTVPMLTFDGLIQDGVSATKRFEVLNQDGVPKKLQLKSYIQNKVFATKNRPRLLPAGGVQKIAAMTSNSEQAGGSNAQSVTASSESASGPAWRAVDLENYDTGWQPANLPSPGAPQWWQIDFATPVSFDYIELGINDTNYFGYKNWEIRASSDGMATYDVIYSATNDVWSAVENLDVNAWNNEDGYNSRKVFLNPNRTKSYTSVRVHINEYTTGNNTYLKYFQLFSGGLNGSATNNWDGRCVYAYDQAFALGQSDFTFEAWVYLRNYQGYNNVFTLAASSTGGEAMSFGVGSSDGVYIYSSVLGWVNNHGPWHSEITRDAWNHFAWVRSGQTTTVFINGNPMRTLGFTYSLTMPYLSIGDSLVGDAALPGQVRNARVTAAARYTAPFSPASVFPVTSNVETLPDSFSEKVLLRAAFDSLLDSDVTQATGALPILDTIDAMGLQADTGTRPDGNGSALVLALPMNGVQGGISFADVSHLVRGTGSALPVTRVGVPVTTISKSRFYGSSVDFGDLGAYGNNKLTLNDSALTLGTGDFTIELWAHPLRIYNWLTLVTTRPDNGAYADAWHLSINGEGRIGFFSDTYDANSAPGCVSINEWQHIAVTRSGSTLRIFKNGLEIAKSTTYNRNLARSLVGVGQFPTGSTEAFSGYLQDLRIYKGVAKYTQDFKAPVLGALYYANGTSLLPSAGTKCLVSYQALS